MRAERMTAVFSLLMIAAVPGAAAQVAGADATPAAEQAPDASRPRQPEPEGAAPVTTFTPTEKIQADSAVSFPVDI
jgi:hypothetical protein